MLTLAADDGDAHVSRHWLTGIQFNRSALAFPDAGGRAGGLGARARNEPLFAECGGQGFCGAPVRGSGQLLALRTG